MVIETECGHDFLRPDGWPSVATGATCDCPVCDELLILVSEAKAVLFHKYMHERNPAWPINGAGTGFVEF